MKKIPSLSGLVAALILLGTVLPAGAYPEFQKFVVQTTGRPVNCALCHVNSDGPEGTAPGQIGHLNQAEMQRLGQARAALQPGQNVESPILNAFGNHIIRNLGKNKFVELKSAPAALADLLPPESDLDGDGIPDAQEFLTGTNPTNRHDGDPLLLFEHNFRSNLTGILLTLAATVAGMWGLKHLLRGFAAASLRKDPDHDDPV